MPTRDAARKLRFIFSTGVLSKANNHLVASKLDKSVDGRSHSQSGVKYEIKNIPLLKFNSFTVVIGRILALFCFNFLPSIDIILWNSSERHNFPQKTSTQNKEKKKEKKNT